MQAKFASLLNHMRNIHEEATRGQANNEEWMKHRRGRVTGSVAHAVMTKQRSKEKKGGRGEHGLTCEEDLGVRSCRLFIASLEVRSRDGGGGKECLRAGTQNRSSTL